MEDVEPALVLFNHWAQAVIHEDEITDANAIRTEWVSPGFDPMEDIRLVFAPDGEMVGYVEVWTTTKPPVHPWIWGRVDPRYEDRGIGTYLLTWAEERAKKVLVDLPEGLRFAPRVGIYQQADTTHKLFNRQLSCRLPRGRGGTLGQTAMSQRRDEGTERHSPRRIGAVHYCRREHEKERDGAETQGAVVRSMPNTPGQIGEGITVWACSKEVTEEQQEMARAIFGALGEEVFVEDESYLDMATALSGSGPAYVFLFTEALIDAGVHMGFPRRIAEQLVLQTIKGSASYYHHAERHPATLRNQVTSPGGTSAEALYYLCGRTRKSATGSGSPRTIYGSPPI